MLYITHNKDKTKSIRLPGIGIQSFLAPSKYHIIGNPSQQLTTDSWLEDLYIFYYFYFGRYILWMQKLPVILCLGVAVLQGLVLAVAGLDMRLANKIDDLSSVDYKSDLSTSLSLSYEVGFFAAAGGLSVLIYIILFITKIANMSVNKTILLSMAHIGSLLQFSIAVHCAILVSKSINPRGKYSNTLPYSLTFYHELYDLVTATTVLYWVLIVPASVIVLHGVAKIGEGAQKVEANSTTVINN